MSHATPRIFAVIPAAGHSRRMGRPKLLIDLEGRTIICRLLDALQSGGVQDVFVLVRQSDQALQDELAGTGARVVRTEETPDMKASVAALLAVIARDESPAAIDSWLLVPADHPLLEPGPVAALLAARRPGETEILVPVHAGRRGHPTCFSWDLAEQVASIAPEKGINSLVRERSRLVREVPVETPAVLIDLDTPEDLERIRQRS